MRRSIVALLCAALVATATGWSAPVRRTALIAIGNPLRVVDERGNVVWQDPAGNDGVWLQWSPDGQRLAFSDDDQVLSVVDRTNWHVEQVVPMGDWPMGDWPMWPSWSPDGSRIAFVNSSDGGEVFVTPSRGCCAKPVSTFAADGDDALVAEWALDGRHLVVLVTGLHPGLVSLDVRTGAVEPLSDSHVGLFDVSPVDGSIAVVSDAGGSAALWRLDADGSDPALLDPGPVGGAFPAWSPDGRWVAFFDGSGVAAVRADGTDRRDMGTDLEWGTDDPPSWLPDSRRLVYTVDEDTAAVVVGLSGDAPRFVTQALVLTGFGPRVSPAFAPVA